MDRSSSFSMNVADSLKHLDRNEQAQLLQNVSGFVDRNCYETPHFHIDIHEQSKTRKGEKGFRTQIRLVGSRKEFLANSENYGAMKSVMEAMNQLEDQVRKHVAKRIDMKVRKK